MRALRTLLLLLRILRISGNQRSFIVEASMNSSALSITLPRFSFRDGFKRHTPTKNISMLLDELLRGYDQKLRPSYGGAPTVIEIDVEVRSMGQISEMDMSYSMDCYFRQSWIDDRLAFSNNEKDFTLSVAVLQKLWRPDTFIYNGKQSYVHLITTPNKFFRLHPTGKILYSSRLTIQANCPMNLEDFPMDTQHCPLKLGSLKDRVHFAVGYTTRDVVYKWNKNRQIVIAKDMKLSQFDLIATPSGFENISRSTGNFSVLVTYFHLRRHMGYFLIQVYAPCSLITVLSWVAFWINREATSDRVALGVYSTLLANFYLRRHMGNFLIQVYGPCMLLVVLSWVSFWLNREATADRISLGVTTVLTMTFLGLEARIDLPKVSYSTALDLFVWLSFGFIFATIIEITIERFQPSFRSKDAFNRNGTKTFTRHLPPSANQKSSLFTCFMSLKCRGKEKQQIVQTSNKGEVKTISEASSALSGLKERPSSTINKKFPNLKNQQINSVSKIDEISRIFFPVAFLIINMLYWSIYLLHSERFHFSLLSSHTD